MKLFEEIFEKKTLSSKEIFRIVYGDGLTDTGSFQLHDFSCYSNQARQEIILQLATSRDFDVLEEFLKSVYMAVMIGMPFDKDDRFETEARMLLIRELLLWAQWGVNTNFLPIYQVAFALIYYHGIEPFGYKLENFHYYDEKYRSDVICGLCLKGFTNVLEAYVVNSRSELEICCDWYTQKWKEIGLPRQVVVLHELANWCDWGAADLPIVQTEIFNILAEYIENQDGDAFTEVFALAGRYLTAERKQKLRQIVLDTNFQKEIFREKFFAVLKGCDA